MKKNKIIIILSFVLLISIIYSNNSFAYFRSDYWECARSGEKSLGDFFGRFGGSDAFDNSGICKKSCCILCTARSPIKDCFGGSAKPMCSCTQGTSTDIIKPELTINSPVQGAIYDKRVVNFNLLSNEKANIDYINYKEERFGYKLLCKRCTSFNRKISFKDGLNNISIRARDMSSNTIEKSISFFVDSIAPKISNTYPKSGNYGNGEFKIEYSEENLDNVTLFYREANSTSIKSITKNNCNSGKKESCVVNISNLQQGQIFYSFKIWDIAGRMAGSREMNIIIDTLAPVITLDTGFSSNQVNNYKNSIPLKLNISEQVNLEYKDLSSNRPNYSRLCTNCNYYNRKFSFRQGIHNILIKATDKAGNFDEKQLVFNIIK